MIFSLSSEKRFKTDFSFKHYSYKLIHLPDFISTFDKFITRNLMFVRYSNSSILATEHQNTTITETRKRGCAGQHIAQLSE